MLVFKIRTSDDSRFGSIRAMLGLTVVSCSKQLRPRNASPDPRHVAISSAEDHRHLAIVPQVRWV